MTNGTKWLLTIATAAIAVGATLLVPYVERSLAPHTVPASQFAPSRPEPSSPAAAQGELRRKLSAIIWASTANKKDRSGHFFHDSSKSERFSFSDDGAYAALVSYTSSETGNGYVSTVACVLIVNGRWELDGKIVRITRSDADVHAEKYTENGRTLDRSKVKMPCSTLFKALKGSTSEFSVQKTGPDWIEVTSTASGKSERWIKNEFTL